MAAKSTLTYLNERSFPKSKSLGTELLINKEGWIKKRSRHLKKWRNRYAQIEDEQYLCTFHDESMNNYTEKIDIAQATILYTIDQPKEFQIHLNDNKTEFYFECDSILDTNDWLRNLKQINVTSSKIPTSPKKSAKKKKNIVINDINLIPTTSILPNSSYDDNKDDTELSETEINQIYMRAVSLYQHKHYEECARITKDVLRVNPNHAEATQLYEHLVLQKYKTDKNVNSNNKKPKRTRQRYKTVAVTKSGHHNHNKPKIKHKMKRGLTLFGRKRDKKTKNDKIKNDAKIAADLTVQATEENKDRINGEQVEQIKLRKNELEKEKKAIQLKKKQSKRDIFGTDMALEILQQSIDEQEEEKKEVRHELDITKDQQTANGSKKQKINPCQLEFQRFITERIQLNKYYEDLGERFEIAKYDDIRFLKDFDAEILGDEIGLRPLHIKCFLRKIEIFLDEIKLFQQWLEQIVLKQKSKDKFNNITSNGLIDLFENNGITTFEALYRYIESKNDLEKIVIGHDDETKFSKMVYDILWNEMRKIEKKQTMRMSVVAQSYGQINADILGINDHDYNGNHIRNPTDDMFAKFAPIDEQQSVDDELNDSLNGLNENEGAQPETIYVDH